MRKLLFIFSPLLLASCVYLFGEPTQKITVITSSGKPASCVLRNKVGNWRTVTGKVVEVKESTTDLKISCVSRKLIAYKSLKATPDGKYPPSVIVYLKVRKATDPEMLPKDNDDSTYPTDAQADDPERDSKPLNVLPDGDGEDQDVEIIRH